MLLEGKVAWITGGANGIGRATARRFAGDGARLVISDLDGEKLGEVCSEIESQGGQVVTVLGSVAERGDVQRMVDATLERFGRLDILINNAGINREGLVTRIKDGGGRL